MSNGDEIDDATLLAYLNKELSNEDMIKVDLWLAGSSKNMQKFNDIRETWRMTGSLKAKPVVVDTDKAWEKVRSKISSDEQVIQMKPQKSKMLIAIAASIVFLIAGMAAFMFFKSDQTSSGNLQLTAQNNIVSGELPDGSEVTLNENSVLEYPPGFSENERRVSLKGECFFDIARDEEKPFIIDLPNSAYVKVLGTSFNIKAIEGEEQSEVYVSTGKVEFGFDNNIVNLVAGEKAVMDNKTGKIEKFESDVNGSAETFWKNQTLDFNGETLSEVVQVISNAYGEKVILECDALANDPVNSTHKGESVEVVLGIINESHPYKIVKSTDKSGTVYRLTCND